MAISGVLVGVLVKWAIDELSAKRVREREDRLRFVADKRQAYADFLFACQRAASAREAYRCLEEDRRGLGDGEDKEYEAKIGRADEAWNDAFRMLDAAMAMIGLLGPRQVVEAAGAFASGCFRPHLLPRRIAAERAFLDAARADLGSPQVGPVPAWEYEPFEDDVADLAEPRG